MSKRIDALGTRLSTWIFERTGKASAVDREGAELFAEPLRRMDRALDSLQPERAYDLLFFSRRKEYFDVSDLQSVSSQLVSSVTFCSNENELSALDRKFDIAIVCTHLMREHTALVVVRSKRLAPLVVVWAWDNHHNPYKNLCFNVLADIILPGHEFCSNALKSPHHVLGKAFPLCTAQWSRSLADEILASEGAQPRSDSLYGGYVMWPGSSRNEELLTLKRDVPDNKITLMEVGDRRAYFDLTPEAQLRDWASYKVSLHIPFSGDLSLRVFDALFAGQIPLVPTTCRDLDGVVPRHLQDILPILRLDETSVPAVVQAWQEGVRRFDAMGLEGVRLRHGFARDNHHITSRLQQIVSYLAGLHDNFEVELRIDDAGIGLVTCPVSPAKRMPSCV